jgi:hypothetical protein
MMVVDRFVLFVVERGGLEEECGERGQRWKEADGTDGLPLATAVAW